MIYFGSVDDQVLKWQSPDDAMDEGRFVTELQLSAIFGEPILLNDGYLLHTPWGRRALLNAGGPLRILNDHGHLRIATRNGGKVGSLVRQMAATIESYAALWADKSLRPTWDELDATTFVVEPWPAKDLQVGLRDLLLARLADDRTVERLGIDQPLLAEFANRFQERLGGATRGVRDKWEAAVQELRHTRLRTVEVNALMRLANEAYHVNFAACFHPRAPSGRSGVATYTGGHFADVREETTLAPRGLAIVIDTLGSIDLPLPRQRFLEPELLSAFLTAGTHEHKAKARFTAELDAACSTTAETTRELREVEARLRSATLEYRDILARQFRTKSDGRSLRITATVVGIAGALAPLAPGGVAVGVLLSVVSAAVGAVAADLVRHVRIRDLSPDLAARVSSRTWLGGFSTFTVKPDWAAQHYANLPDFPPP